MAQGRSEVMARNGIVTNQSFDPQRSTELGFRAENTFEEIIRVHIEEDLGGKIAA